MEDSTRPSSVSNSPIKLPEIGGGVECSVIRVRDTFHSQLTQNGHLERTSDLQLFSQLGIKTLRFPVIWETEDGHYRSTRYNFK